MLRASNGGKFHRIYDLAFPANGDVFQSRRRTPGGNGGANFFRDRFAETQRDIQKTNCCRNASSGEKQEELLAVCRE